MVYFILAVKTVTHDILLTLFRIVISLVNQNHKVVVDYFIK
jgi:hypothetical protein